jgi:hypothetical protein
MSVCEYCRARFANAEAMRSHSAPTDFGVRRCMDWQELRDAGWRLSADRGWVAPARHVACKVSA